MPKGLRNVNMSPGIRKCTLQFKGRRKNGGPCSLQGTFLFNQTGSDKPAQATKPALLPGLMDHVCVTRNAVTEATLANRRAVSPGPRQVPRAIPQLQTMLRISAVLGPELRGKKFPRKRAWVGLQQ